jgi:hypothetical protein
MKCNPRAANSPASLMLYQFHAMLEESKSQAFASFSLLVQFKTI